MHDICDSSAQLPSQLRISGVIEGRFFGSGGQAIISKGDFNGRAVAIRQPKVIRGYDWGSDSGISHLKARLLHL